jgi:BirA family biotin operon repressor/biotin-[acetyl-CoA-carboxylase] ligase
MKNQIKTEPVIELLKGTREYLSGAEIASRLGLTRAAIWKRVNTLRKKGYIIEGSPTKGYKLIESPDLSIEEIRNALSIGSHKIGSNLMFYNTVASTNAVCVELAHKGSKEGLVIIADEQTSGRGRLGRKWVSPAGKNLYMSVLLIPPISPRDATILTLMSGVACCIALRKLLLIPIHLKWPNDLILNDKKIGGILTEISADMDKISYAVIGVGININADIEDFPEEVRQIATSVKKETGSQFRRTEIAAEVLKEFDRWYENLLTNGKKDILAEWRDCSSTIGRKVKVTIGNQVFKGIAEEIDQEGLLIMKLPDGSIMKVDAGDITMLREGE